MPSRRTLLASIGTLSTAAIAGCSGGGSDTPTLTPTQTTTENSTSTASPTPTNTDYPQLITAAVLHSWESYGDIYDHQVDRIPIGVRFSVGARIETRVHDGEVTLRMQTEIRRDEELVDRETEVISNLTDEEGVVEWAIATGLTSVDWEAGDYTAEVIVQDPTTGETTEPATLRFGVVDATATPE